MSSYSMQLRTIVEQASQYVEGLNTRDKIEQGRLSLFDFDYPIFDEAYRKVFETNFIRHFYMREIGFETEGRFKFELESWLLLHMPYYNRLFESELLEFDPLKNSSAEKHFTKTKDISQNDTRTIDTDTTVDGTSNTTNTASSSVTDNGSRDVTTTSTDDNFERDIEMDTPDSRLSITTNDGQGVIEYASQIDEKTTNNQNTTDSGETSTNTSNAQGLTEVDGTTSTTGASDTTDTLVSTINDLEDYIEVRSGKIGVQSYAKLLMEFRTSFIRIEQQMFKEMQQLFMLVY